MCSVSVFCDAARPHRKTAYIVTIFAETGREKRDEIVINQQNVKDRLTQERYSKKVES